MLESIFHTAKKERPLRAPFLKCTLKKGPETSHTEVLCSLLIDRLKFHEPDIETEIVRVVDYNVVTGVANDEGGAKLLRDNPYQINIAEHNRTMMQRNQVKMAAMQKAMQHMRENLTG